MAKSRNEEFPDNAVRIRDHVRLQRSMTGIVQSWSAEDRDRRTMTTLLLGPAGQGKTEIVKAAIQQNAAEDPLVIKGNQTAFELYKALHEHNGVPVVIDDVNSILRDHQMIGLLQAATDTGRSRIVRWGSNHPHIGDGAEQIPQSFEFNSPVIVILNDWNATSHAQQSLADRARVFYYRLPPTTLHSDYVTTWFPIGTDAGAKAVHDYIGEHLEYVSRLTCRVYVNGLAAYYADREFWRDDVLDMIMDDEELELMVVQKAYTQIECNGGTTTEAAASISMPRSTYQRKKKELGLTRKYTLNGDSKPGVAKGTKRPRKSADRPKRETIKQSDKESLIVSPSDDATTTGDPGYHLEADAGTIFLRGEIEGELGAWNVVRCYKNGEGQHRIGLIDAYEDAGDAAKRYRAVLKTKIARDGAKILVINTDCRVYYVPTGRRKMGEHSLVAMQDIGAEDGPYPVI